MRKTQQKSSVLRAVMQSVTSCISITLVLLLLGMTAFFVLSARNLSAYVRENLTFSVILSDDVNDTAALQMKSAFEKEAYVKSAVYISKEQALKETVEELGTDPSDFIGENPFSASIEIKLNAAYANSDSISVIENSLSQSNDIDELVYQKDLIDMVNSNISKISLFLLCLAVILSLISLGLINNTIRLSIYAKRFTIHTMKLVGASWGFIRRPFVMRQVMVGVVSAVVSDVMLCGAAAMLLDYQPELAGIVTPRLLAAVSLFVLLCGVIITFLCSYFSINRYLRMKAGDLYYI